VDEWQGGRGFRREGVGVRDGARVGWIEETQRKTKGWVLKEGWDEHDVLFLSQTALPLLCICAATCLCLSDVYAQTKVCYVTQMTEMCGYGVKGSGNGVGVGEGRVGVVGSSPGLVSFSSQVI
jgi:hypothetical protein